MKENTKKKIDTTDPDGIGKDCRNLAVALCAFSAVVSAVAYKLDMDYIPWIGTTAISALVAKFCSSKKIKKLQQQNRCHQKE